MALSSESITFCTAKSNILKLDFKIQVNLGKLTIALFSSSLLFVLNMAICTQLLKLELFARTMSDNEDIWYTSDVQIVSTYSARVYVTPIHAPLMQRPTRALFK